ncbi:MAG: hypothetical protein Q7R93_04270 [bacterium]|nr:hypothetical protein [bacterium]
MPSNLFSDLLTPDVVAPWLSVFAHLRTFLDYLAPFSTVFSLVLITGIVYCFLRIEQIVHETRHEDVPHGGGHGHESTPASAESPSEKRWQRVLAHVNSDRESDWRLAVLEADVLLDEMVTNMGYHGDSLGEKLKAIERSDFTTLDQAWEAHSVRNRIAHEGAAFAFTEREGKRVVKLYEDVFKEFHFI